MLKLLHIKSLNPHQAMGLCLAIVLLAWTSALVMDYMQHRNARLYLTHNLELWIQDQVRHVDELAGDDLIIQTYLMDKSRMPAPMYAAFRERMLRLADLPFALFYTLNDSLIYWNKGVPGVQDKQLRDANNDNTLIRLADGWYLLQKRYLSDSVNLVAYIPVKYDYPLENPYLKEKFPGSLEMPGKVGVSMVESVNPIRLADGGILAYLHYERASKSLPRQNLLLGLFLFAGLITAFFFHLWGAYWIQKGKRQFGAFVFLAGIFGLRFISLWFDFTGHFGQLPIFQRSMDHPILSHSIGDLLINVSLLLWVIIFFYKEVSIQDFSRLSIRKRIGMALVNYLAIASGLLAMIHLFQILVLESDLTFRFDDIFHFNTFSFLSLIAVQLLLIALFLFSYRLQLFINAMNLNRKHRYGAILAAVVIGVACSYWLPIAIPALVLTAILLGYLMIFEVYADVKSSNLTWIILWMILFSGLASGLLYHFNNTKIDLRLKEYADLLIDPTDVFLEKDLTALSDYLSVNSHVTFSEAFTRFPYVKQYYRWEESLEGQVDSQLNWSWNRFQQNGNYEMVSPNGNIYMFQQVSADYRKVYGELLRTVPFKGMPDIENFRYQLTQNDKVLMQSLPESAGVWRKEILDKTEREFFFNKKELRGMVLNQDEFRLMIVHASGGRSAFLSLFSYLFCLLTITLFLITLLNTAFDFLPDTLNFSLSHRLSLRNRIQFSVISLIVLSFLIIGMITIFYFKNTTEEYHQERLQRKALSVAKDLDKQLARNTLENTTEIDLILGNVSRVHETDVDIFNEEGKLIYSSEPLVYEQKLVSPYMDGRALAAMTLEKSNLYIGENQIGELQYRTAYLAMPVGSNRQTGFVAIPYYSDRSFLQQDISEFISALLNVYVFLLFIAGALAILVANSITYPISVIGEKLKQFKLGKNNEPLEWSSKDELGELIAEYNRMIRKLQESATLLARSEREGAWREMAKQVAHEIKNPLTPMKLSLQHLQMAFKPARPEDQILMNRVSATLIEQIENLSQIASAFSNFAKIPEANPEELVVNDLLESIHNLFREQEDRQLTINLDLPVFPVHVFVDKNQLLRVFSNLVKNAIQAIPEDSVGLIHIKLATRDESAVISIQDNGVGIPPETSDKVFMPNFTTKNSGTGLGLAICKNIIDQMQGDIYFETQPGKGTTFYVSLPLG